MRDNKSGIEQAIHNSTAYGVLFPVLLGFSLLFVALPIAAWQSGQKKWFNRHRS